MPVSFSPVPSIRRLASPTGGFTLLELLVVMAIIGLLASYVAPRYFAQIGKTEAQAAQVQIDALEKALEQYRIDVGRFPNGEQGLSALMQRPTEATRWHGPYLKKAVPMDPWGRPYQYRVPGERSEVDLVSLGPDGIPSDDDIGNW